ncbi:fibronectin type III domain-containing protein [Bacillus carboniphilus]|uniref:Fibronectin type III domain-containing protein n=1 Tax=Bacillus carboniphilus TaxID=86663 RepID=A0ABY9JVM0_9BACI|nr:fibronectin type III domain-containing protein [Bacillus carboniphilus]WLR41731.1 fibronectin type III domain-containing protein [Bacillus carboniphilus]
MKKHNSFLFIITFLTIAFVNTSIVNADTINWKPTYDLTSTSIQLEWSEIADSYEVIMLNKAETVKDSHTGEENTKLTNKSIWKGKDTTYTIEGLMPERPYQIQILAIENGKGINSVLLDLMTLKESTKSDKESFKLQSFTSNINENQMLDAYINSTLNEDELTLNWTGLPDEDLVYEVYNGSTLLDTVEGNSYTTKVTDGEVYYFSVKGKVKLDESAISERIAQAKSLDISITQDIEASLSYQDYALYYTKEISIENDSLASMNFKEYVDTFVFKYMTFIPLKYGETPYPYRKWDNMYYFGGDTRTQPDFWSSDYRTMFVVYAFLGEEKGIIDYSIVNYSTAYDKNKKLVAVDTEEDGEIYVSNIIKRSDYIFFQLNHSVDVPFDLMDNPLFTPPNIDYRVGTTLYTNGDVVIQGSRDKAPSHEYWGIPYGSDFPIPLYFGKHSGNFNSLFGIDYEIFTARKNLVK